MKQVRLDAERVSKRDVNDGQSLVLTIDVNLFQEEITGTGNTLLT